MSEPRARLTRIAEQFHGVFTREDALTAGLSSDQLDGAVAAGQYERIYPSVYAVSGAPRTMRLFQRAACVWAGPDGSLSHRSALAEHGLIGFKPDAIEVTTSARRCHGAPIIVHRTNYLPPHHVVEREGLRLTDVERTLFDAGAVVPQHVVTRAVETAIRTGLTTRKRLLQRLIEHGGRGRRGCAKLRVALDDLHPQTAQTDTALETLMLRVVWNGRLPRPEVQYKIRCKGKRRRLDFAYPDIKWNIEGDGFDEHGRKISFDADRERDRELEAEGWLITRLTWDQLKDGGSPHLLDELCQIYEQRKAFFGS
jgi:predicted transcriptional regulator of viral defense system